jgi:DNA-binding transcriptional LysR family regulator
MMAWTQDSYLHVEAGSCDMALGVGSAPIPTASLKVEVLYEEEFVCLVDAKTSSSKKRFSLAEYVRRPHASFTTLDGQQSMSLPDRSEAFFSTLKQNVFRRATVLNPRLKPEIRSSNTPRATITNVFIAR